MKTLIILGLISFVIGCKSISYSIDENIKIIKYKGMDKVKYDWYESVYPFGAYMTYIKTPLSGTVTNYIYGSFELINHEQYLAENE